MKKVDIGPIIKQKFTESSMTTHEFADKIICGRTNVYNIFKKQSINSDLIYRISKALNYDFYNEIYLNISMSRKLIYIFNIPIVRYKIQ